MSSDSPRRTAPSTSPTFTIREGRVADADAIEAVHFASREAAYAGRVAEWPPPGLDRAGRAARWRTWLADPSIACLVGELNEEIVGFITIRPSSDPDADASDVAEMPTLYVRPDAWSEGFGQALCRAGLQNAVERGFRTLTLWVVDLNTRARTFYELFGFEPDGATTVDEATPERLTATRYRMAIGDAGV